MSNSLQMKNRKPKRKRRPLTDLREASQQWTPLSVSGKTVSTETAIGFGALVKPMQGPCQPKGFYPSWSQVLDMKRENAWLGLG
jgi:hypothetical protein